MDNTTAFMEAIEEGDLEAVQKMAAEEPSLLQADAGGPFSPLLLSVYHGNSAVTEWLLSQEIGPLTIWEAAAVGDVARVRTLVEEEPALVDEHAADGFTPLGLAAFFGRVEVLSLLLELGGDADLAAANEMRVQPIHSAAAHRRPDVALTMVRHLLAHGADPNAAQHGGWTPLHQAAAHGHGELVQLLLEHDADPEARSEDGRSPAAMAREGGFEALAERLSA